MKMLKKPYLYSAYNTIQQCNICTPVSTTSPFSQSCPRTRADTYCQRRSKWRSYGTIRDGKGPDFRDNMNWPCRKSAASRPTPYEIFDLERGAVYSKYKYYQLVKLYHPDHHSHHDTKMLSQRERLERYRLVVQAHEILSDPVKRRAYDAYGAGWGERTITRHSRGHSNSDGREYGHGQDQDKSPFGNATWEDWERWYRRKDTSQQQEYTGTYVNPNAFASFVIIFAILTGILQATRVGHYSSSLSEKVQTYTEETNEFLTTRAQSLSENKLNADDRVKHFLERRDPSKYGLKDEEEEAYRKHFAAAEHFLSSKDEKKTEPG